MALQLIDDARAGGSQLVVRAAGHRSTLTSGESVSFGRGVDQDLRLGHDPEDRRVPRRAGQVECRQEGALVHNVSGTRSIIVRTFSGPLLEIPPATVLGVSNPIIQLVLVGGNSREYTVDVDSRHLAGSKLTSEEVHPGSATVGYDRVATLTRRERELLLALCLPVVAGQMRRGEAPTYAEMEVLLQERGCEVAARRVRKGLDALRRKLVEHHQVDDLVDDGSPVAGGKQSFLPVLAHWAIASGTVTLDDVDRFDQGELDAS